MKTLYIGGTGEISYSCIHAGATAGHDITVFNRGRCAEPLPAGVRQILGDMADAAAYRRLADTRWDVVCQFRAYDPAAVQKDIKVFSRKIGQYIFISSASVYSKPPQSYVLTESHPIGNVFWSYSENKARAEQTLMAAFRDQQFPVTIVRPSHTYRRNFPGTVLSGDDIAWRMLNGKQNIIHGDGTSLWTYTHADDFAGPFVRLLGRPKTAGEAFQVTAHLQAYSWNAIYAACAAALGAEPKFTRIPTDAIVRAKPDVAGNLQGDKMWPSVFDNAKLISVVGDYACPTSLADGLAAAAVHVKKRLATFEPNRELHAFIDRLALAQNAVAAP